MHFYYRRFRAASPSRGGYAGSEVKWAVAIHVSLMLVVFHPLGAVIGPMFFMLTIGERNRNLESEAMDAFNFAVIVTLLATGVSALDQTLRTYWGMMLPPLALVMLKLLLAVYVGLAIRRVRQGLPHTYKTGANFLTFPARGSRGATLGTDIYLAGRRRFRR